MNYQITTYTDNQGREREAIEVPWEEVERTLGRPHEGFPEDDDKIQIALWNAGAPKWLVDAEDGYVDDSHWGLIKAD